MNMEIQKLRTSELETLTALFAYNDVADMIAENTQALQNGAIDIFVLRADGQLIGELRAKYSSDDPRFAIPGRRAYLYAFRIHPNHQGKGWGQFLLQSVLTELTAMGYTEFTVGVEDDNERARHLYEKFGFTTPIARIGECYQGDRYEFDLLLRSGD